jgi:translation elongation factor EF-Ts
VLCCFLTFTLLVFQLNSETDFVGRGPKFTALASSIAEITLDVADAEVSELHTETAIPVDRVLTLPMDGEQEGATVQTSIADLIYQSGENVVLQRTAALRGSQVFSYIHQGKRAALVSVDIPNAEDAARIGPKLAMHVIGYMPQVISPTDGVSSSETLLQQDFALLDSDAGTVGEVLDKAGAKVHSFVRWTLGELVEIGEQEDFAQEVQRKMDPN